MSFDQVQATLQAALHSGIHIEARSFGSYLGTRPSMFSEFVSTESTIYHQMIELLKRHERLNLFDGGALIIGGTGMRVELPLLADWLLITSVRQSAQIAIDWLEGFLNGQYREGIEVLAVSGITVSEPFFVTDNVQIIPFSDLPQSFQKDELSDDADSLSWPSLMRQPQYVAPTIAVVSYHTNVVRLGPELRLSPEYPPPFPFLVSELFDLASVLAVIGPCSPTPVATWIQALSPEHIPVARMGYGAGTMIHEAWPRTNVMVSTVEVHAVAADFLALPKQTKERLSVPLSRLALSSKRMQRTDRAIELGIALESLLIASEGENNTEISYRVRQRGALLGSNTAQERTKISKLIGTMYSLRSSAVHRGKVQESEDTDRILDDAAQLCALLIRQIIKRKGFPDWATWLCSANFPDELGER